MRARRLVAPLRRGLWLGVLALALLALAALDGGVPAHAAAPAAAVQHSASAASAHARHRHARRARHRRAHAHLARRPRYARGKWPRRGKCFAGSHHKCFFWIAKVNLKGHVGARKAGVADGDTIRVHFPAPTRFKGLRRIRLTGLNAIEMLRYSTIPSRVKGECHAVAAYRYVYKMIRRAHGWVRLAAQHPSSHSGVRLRRDLSVRSHGHWVDIAAYELRNGLALWLVNGRETAWDKKYGLLSEQAEIAHRGLFDPDGCPGAQPEPGADLRLWVKWDADGPDAKNLDDEWARIRNDGAAPVSLAGWYFRDSAYRGKKAHGYTFPSGTVVPAGGEITLHVGNGTNTASDLYWGLGASIWGNVGGRLRYNGDGGYLFDPHGDVRAYMTYPCLVGCHDPLVGNIKLVAHPDTHKDTYEHVDITNTSSAPVDLEGYQLYESPNYYNFAAGDVLNPGETLRLYLERGPAQAAGIGATLNWGLNGYQMPDKHGFTALVNYRDRVIACDAWGGARCWKPGGLFSADGAH